jgi:hypothetical protein
MSFLNPLNVFAVSEMLRYFLRHLPLPLQSA